MWSQGYTGKGINIGVIDTGCGPNSSIIPAHSCESCAMNCSAWNNDLSGHGTHVAGLIGARFDAKDAIIGGAPESNLFCFKCSDKGTFLTSDLIHALGCAVKQKMVVINNSWGGVKSKALQDAFSNALKEDCLCIKSAGNGYKVSDDCYSDVIMVTAVDFQGRKAPFANTVPLEFNSETVQAYGVKIFSHLPHNKIAPMSGTSMAAALTSAAVALVAQKTGFKGKDLRDYFLQQSVVPNPRMGCELMGLGLVKLQ